MTKRERVYATIRRQPLDAIPWQFDLTSAVVARLRACLKTDQVPAALDDHFVCTGMSAPQPVSREPVPAGCYRDAFGAVWRREAADRSVGDWGGHVDYPLHEPSLNGYTFPDPLADPTRTQTIRAARQAYPDHFLWSGGGGLFEQGWALCGFENYLGYVAGEEGFVEEMTTRLADYCCLEMSLLKGLGLDAVRFGDDWGFQNSLMITPAVWRRVFKKHYQRIIQAAHAAGLIAMLHSCGRIEDIIPDLIEVGLDVLHPLQPEANDVARCQREFGRDITFWGALGSQSTIPLGTVADVRREVRDRLRLFHDGGYVLAPAGAAPAETPAENIIAIADEARAQTR
jgi:uroporphyrinogen decarboxylase